MPLILPEKNSKRFKYANDLIKKGGGGVEVSSLASPPVEGRVYI